MTIKFDSAYHKFDDEFIVSNECKITKYNSIFRLNYNKLELIINRFKIEEKRGGSSLLVYDSNNLLAGILNISEGSWIY